MIDTKQLLKYVQSRGKVSTIEEIDKLVEEYDRESATKNEKKRFNQIDDLLSLLIRDLNEEIRDTAETIAERMKCDQIDEDK